MLKKVHSYPFAIFLILYLLTLLFYYGTQDARLASDFYNWIGDYTYAPLSDLWTCFGYPGLHQLYHIPFYTFYKIAHLNVWAWHFLFTGIHAFNALLIYFLVKKIFFEEQNKKANISSFFPSLLFLLSPYQTEVVAWGACIHYLLMCTFLLSSLLFLLRFLKYKNWKSGVIFHGFFLLALFCMEQSYLFPVIYIAFAILFAHKFKIKPLFIITKLFLPQLIFFVMYFGLAQLVFGQFIGHYGAEGHLHFDIDQLSDNVFNYVGKFLFFYRYTPSSIDALIQNIFGNDGFQIITGSLFLMSCIYFLFKKLNQSPSKKHLFLFSIGSFILVLAPVLNLPMDSTWLIQTDRYSYVASPFIFFALYCVLSRFSFKNINPLLLLLVVLNGYTLWQTNLKYKETGQLKVAMLENFPLEEARDIYLLNLPDNHDGVHLFRNGFASAIDLHYGKDIKYHFHTVSHVNTLSIEDSVVISSLTQNSYNVELMHWGRWGHTFENEDEVFKMLRTHDAGYRLTLKESYDKKLHAFYYLKGGEWVECDFEKF